MRSLIFLASLVFLASCAGTDYVDDPVLAERLTISPRIDSIEVGETVQFSATFYNEFGEVESKAATWQSTNPDIVSIDENGLAEGLAEGPVKITASAGSAADTLVLNTTGVTNSADLRTGVFQDAGNHYHTSGNVRLEQLENGSLQLVFEENFEASAGPSLYVLLANHTSGSYSVTNGGNAVNGTSAQVTPTRLTSFSGARTYAVPAGIGINDYKYVVLYCTLGPVFGFSELN